MPTANDLINRSLRLIGAIAAGETPSAAMADDALTSLRALQDEWQLDDLNMVAILSETYAVVADQQDYTIGPGGDFDRPTTPISFDAASLVLASSQPPNTEIPLQIFTEQEWEAQLVKPLTNDLYTGMKYERQPETGLGLISLWPIPTTNVNDLRLYIPTSVETFPDLATNVILPAGYENAYVYNLAIELSPEYPQATLNELILSRAREALARVKRANIQPVELGTDPALWPMPRSSYNIKTDSGG